MQRDHATLQKSHEDCKLELDTAKRKVERLKAKDEQETSALNDMVERIEQNLLNATRRAQAAEERVAELERQAGRERDAVEQASFSAMGDEESRQLLKFYRGRYVLGDCVLFIIICYCYCLLLFVIVCCCLLLFVVCCLFYCLLLVCCLLVVCLLFACCLLVVCLLVFYCLLFVCCLFVVCLLLVFVSGDKRLIGA